MPAGLAASTSSAATGAHQLICATIARTRRTRGVALITGPSGTGKTTAAADAVAAARAGGCAAFHMYVRRALPTLREAQQFLLRELGVDVEQERQTTAYELQRRLETYPFPPDALIVVDDAQQASSDLLAVIRDFVDERHRRDEPIGIVLIGLPTLRARILADADPKVELASLAGRLVAEEQVGAPEDDDLEAVLRNSVGLVGGEALAIARRASDHMSRLRRLTRVLEDAREFAGDGIVGLTHLRQAAELNGLAE
jgi:type II secretory pathway predicted ATPase ExeA